MSAIEQAHALLDQLARERYYGSVSFQFKNGEVVLIRREETIVPSSAESKATNGRTGGSGHERNQSR
jgi:hypothetical protein